MKRPALAALLSFLWPGLGQAYRGERSRGTGQALPVIVAFGLAAAALLWFGPLVVAAYLLNPLVSLSLIAVVAALATWRAWSLVDALAAPEPLQRRPAEALLASVLVAAVVLSHVWVGLTLLSFYRTGQQISQPQPIAAQPTPSPGASAPGASARPSPSPAPLPGSRQRVTILLVGLDNTHGDALALTDTLIVASYDPRDQSLVMISLPRDTARVPLYSGGTYKSRVNTLRQAATRHPESYPDGPMGTLVNEMSFLVGVPIDYYAIIGITGFSELIDSVGGIDVDVKTPIEDRGYQFTPTEVGFYLDAGPHHLDGKYATAFARSRHGSSDYARAARQQQVILALRQRLDDPLVLTNLPALLGAVSQIVRTDAPLERLPEIVSIVQRSATADTQNIVLAPPRYAGRAMNAEGEPTSMTELRMDAVAELSVSLFGIDSRYFGDPSFQLPLSE